MPVVDANPETTKDNWAILTVIADLTDTEGFRLVTFSPSVVEAAGVVAVDHSHKVAVADSCDLAMKALEVSKFDLY